MSTFFGKTGRWILRGVVTALLLTSVRAEARPALAASRAIREGSRVTAHLTLIVDGRVATSTMGKGPLTFVMGDGEMIPVLENHLLGLKRGETKEVTLLPEQGFGLRDPQLVKKVPRKELEQFNNMKVGDTLVGVTPKGPVEGRILAINRKEITVDLNHPLAGKELHFSIEIVSVN